MMDELDPTQDPMITENEDGSADVDLRDDLADIEEMPDGSAVVTMPNDGPEENPDFYSNMAESYDEYDLSKLAMRGHDHEPKSSGGLSDHKRKVTMNKDMDTMLLELTRNKKAK